MIDLTSLLGQIAGTVFNVVYLGLIVGTIVVIVLDNRNPVKTLAWILVLIFLPIIGLVLYFFFGRSQRHERMISRKGYNSLLKKPMLEYMAQTSTVIPEEYSRLIALFRNTNQSLPFDGNRLEAFTTGEAMLQALLREMQKATHHIHLESYIFEDDALGRMVRDVLMQKAGEGVEIRVLYDDVGCWHVPDHFFETMREAGIDVRSFLKVRFPHFTNKMNYRNHRKLVIYFVDRTLLTKAVYFPKTFTEGSALVQVATSEPVGEWKEIMQGLAMAIYRAKKYFYIQTPYFLPTETILVALQTAALAGVDIRLMLPWRADSRLTHLATCSYLADMLHAGVKVYFYRKGFLHSKLMVSDDQLSTVGSTNMDFRSFEHNFEVNAFIYDTEFALQMREVFLQDQRDCEQLHLKHWEKRPSSRKMLESFVRLLSPLL